MFFSKLNSILFDDRVRRLELKTAAAAAAAVAPVESCAAAKEKLFGAKNNWLERAMQQAAAVRAASLSFSLCFQQTNQTSENGKGGKKSSSAQRLFKFIIMALADAPFRTLINQLAAPAARDLAGASPKTN